MTERCNEDLILQQAQAIIENRYIRGQQMLSVQEVRDYLMLKLAPLEHEVFGCLLLDNQQRILAYKELFRGTINGVNVYPREVVKLSLGYNAAALILVHNHPSGEPEPSQADLAITQRLVSALELVDVRVLDHFIVAGTRTVSMAERGLL
ncbi:DNA repair protein RadC [Serratia fonticola]|uniref:RadC family protein n=1 Tax=Serratia fonticola TaxID=47917 RepID=UPI0015C6685F|nr:DNA repair protein RadC [Serratia fonticola]MBC3382023.1 DNA repair protein RadC [Serratia fonticola]NYA41223.1 DNA repair protein RadC [Serratia fonticola]